MLSLLRDATVEDICRLLNFDLLRESVYVFHAATRSVAHVRQADRIPWPVVWILGKYHKTFVFVNRRPPQLSTVFQNIDDFIHKVHWRAALKTQSSVDPVIRSFRFKRRPLRCTADFPAELGIWTDRLRRDFFRCAQSGVSSCFSRSSNFSNVNKLDCLGFRMLKQIKMSAIPTDKDGGYVLVRHSDHSEFHHAILRRDCYDEVGFWRSGAGRTYGNYENIASDISKTAADDDSRSSLFASLMSAIRAHGRNVAAKLEVTVKTHKPPGCVKPRNIHSCSRSPFIPMGRWLNYVFRENVLSRYPHICKDSDDFLKRIEHVNVDATDLLIRIDVEEFFMSGEHPILAEEAVSMIKKETCNVKLSKLVDRAVLFLLDNQFVHSDLLPGRLFKVRYGSGMGTVFSGDLSDVCFLSLCEIWALRNLQRFGIKSYSRFKDDIFVIASGFESFRDFLTELRKRAGPFRLTVEEYSYDWACMLDLRIFKGNRWRRSGLLDFDPLFKPTSLAVPLAVDSGHPPHVHFSWPFAELNRLARHSSDRNLFLEAKATFLTRFKSHYAPQSLLTALSAYDPFSCRPTQLSKRAGTSDVLWLVIPYHWAWRKCQLTNVLQQALSSPLWAWIKEEHSINIEVRISWKLGSIHSQTLFKRISFPRA